MLKESTEPEQTLSTESPQLGLPENQPTALCLLGRPRLKGKKENYSLLMTGVLPSKIWEVLFNASGQGRPVAQSLAVALLLYTGWVLLQDMDWVWCLWLQLHQVQDRRLLTARPVMGGTKPWWPEAEIGLGGGCLLQKTSYSFILEPVVVGLPYARPLVRSNPLRCLEAH